MNKSLESSVYCRFVFYFCLLWLMCDCIGKTATGLGPGIRFKSGGEAKAVSLLADVWPCGVKSPVTEVVRVHLGLGAVLGTAVYDFVWLCDDVVWLLWFWLILRFVQILYISRMAYFYIIDSSVNISTCKVRTSTSGFVTLWYLERHGDYGQSFVDRQSPSETSAGIRWILSNLSGACRVVSRSNMCCSIVWGLYGVSGDWPR